eukprot:TRINITY_DN11431_c0_g1_i5.p3 TRINITY_DN11431_c0_g1~~TRINITY_DN11431_c0_g1_i5.p3  ORF type:complete len:138 (+),score=20.88 TRINITY_DN11431_c0_g1_i5:1607-2020(+)
MLPNISVERVSALLQHLHNTSEFGTPVPIPTVARTDPTYSTNMWRGAMWINVNYFAIIGLRQYTHVSGAASYAAELKRLTLDVVAQWYKETGVIFEFYDSMNKVNPNHTARKKHFASGSVRDYHWSAALIYRLLHEP